MSDAITSEGILLKRDTKYDSSSESYTTIAEVIDCSGPQLTRTTVDVTHLASPDGFMEFVSGMKDGGEISFTCNYTYDEYILLKADLDRNTLTGYQIYIPSSVPRTISFDGLLTKLGGPTAGVNNKLVMNCSIKISGNVTPA